MLNRLPPKEREIIDVLYQRGSLTALAVTESLPGGVSRSTVRTMLRRLEEKGFVRRQDGEQGFVYSPALSGQAARKSVLAEVVRVFFNGSATSAASALLGMSEVLHASELDALEQMIADARDARGI